MHNYRTLEALQTIQAKQALQALQTIQARKALEALQTIQARKALQALQTIEAPQNLHISRSLPVLSSRRNEVKERILKVQSTLQKKASCLATSRYARCARYDKKGRFCNIGKDTAYL